MKKRVLVIDDSATVRLLISSGLSGIYDVLTATDGRDGLNQAKRQKPDAIIVDIEMPVMDGAELIAELKGNAATASIPTIVVTAVAEGELMNECRALGCSGYALKPVNIEYLKAKLRQLIGA